MSDFKKENLEHQKLDIINWVININDENVLKKIYSLKKQSDLNNEDKPVRQFGFGKGTFTYISDDFDEPLDDFKEYM